LFPNNPYFMAAPARPSRAAPALTQSRAAPGRPSKAFGLLATLRQQSRCVLASLQRTTHSTGLTLPTPNMWAYGPGAGHSFFTLLALRAHRSPYYIYIYLRCSRCALTIHRILSLNFIYGARAPPPHPKKRAFGPLIKLYIFMYIL
jgi:hypothetical protein